MTLNKLLGGALVVQLVILGTLVLAPAQTTTQSASAAQASDKYDVGCTGHETAGRCQDKCPNQSDTLLGYDPTTSAAICKAAPTGCPYGDSIPLGPDCDKHIPQTDTAQPEVVDFGGK